MGVLKNDDSIAIMATRETGTTVNTMLEDVKEKINPIQGIVHKKVLNVFDENLDKLEKIEGKDGINIEFKQSRNKLNKDVFDSVCAFLNRNGVHLFLGLGDDGNVVGIDMDSIDKIKKKFVTSMNNPIKISPTFYLTVEEVEIGDKVILYIFVPESSQVHRCNGKIYDRNEDGDLDITDNTNLVAKLYMRKQSTYTENEIFP